MSHKEPNWMCSRCKDRGEVRMAVLFRFRAPPWRWITCPACKGNPRSLLGTPSTAEAKGERMTDRCNIKHGFHDGRCIREKGHDGFCRCKAERMGGGSIMYSEWQSKDGKFHRHVGYRTIYPANAIKENQ